MRPQVTPDTAFFWAGTAAGELRIQRCSRCGALRHPPGPMCPACGEASDGRYLVAAGTGEVFSYVVHHHPPVPGKRLPMVVALVQLPEGVRMVGEMPGVRPDQVRIGLPVRATFVRPDSEHPEDLTLPAWRLAEGALPDLVIDVTPTFVIASALATRDFQDVHHDRDRAVARGARDIFVNILTTTGLVQRYVSAWAGPDAVVRAVSIRLGVPCHAGETLTLSGQVTPVDGTAEGDERVVSVTGRCGLGDHVSRPPSGLSPPDDDRGHRRHRRDRVLQGFGAQRAAARRRGGAGRARRRRARARPTWTAWSRSPWTATPRSRSPVSSACPRCVSSARSATAAARRARPCTRRRWPSRPGRPAWWSATAR